MSPSLAAKLYIDQPRCLHTENYLILHPVATTTCGPCFFREGVLSELPTRINMREDSGLFGSPQFNPHFIAHLMISAGLVPPEPTESLKQFRKRRRKQSQPSPKLFPFTSSLWSLMGFQPPLARVLIKFCEGYSEVEIADELDLSLYNVQDRLRKSVQVSKKFLRLSDANLRS